MLVIGYVFKYIFMPTRCPRLGKALGIKWLSTSLLTNEQLSWIPIVFLAVWRGIAYSVLIYLAGLQTIDDKNLRAAAIDSVNAWQKFWKIRIPADRTVLHHQPRAVHEGNALGSLRSGRRLDRGAVELLHRNRHPTSSGEGGLTGGESTPTRPPNAVLFFIVLAIIAFVQLRISRSQEQI